MQELRDVQEDNTFSFISIKSHNTFPAAESASTVSITEPLERVSCDSTATSFFQTGAVPKFSLKKIKNSIPVSGKYMKLQQTRHLEGEPRNRPTVY